MSLLSRDAALSAVQTLLRPLASFVLKCGLSYREFGALAKTAFVAAATSDYGIQGRPTNVSRVALLTGISRKEVKRQRELIDEQRVNAPVAKTTAATRLLSGWYQDADFLSTDSDPRGLTDSEFGRLCRRYCSDVPATAMLKELRRVGAVTLAEDHLWRPISRYYMPVQTDPEWMMNAGSYIADLSAAINFNMAADHDAPKRFVGRATEPSIPVQYAGEFHAFVEVAGQQFLESVDAWLAEHQCGVKDAPADESMRLGVGLFLIESAASKTN